MKRYRAHIIIVLLFVVFVAAYLFYNAMYIAKRDGIRAYSEKATSVYMEQPENIAPAVKILTDGLSVYPDAAILLESRCGLYCSNGMLPECRADTLQLLRLKPDRTEARMMLCMLNEFEGANQQACDACYGEVVTLLATKALAPSPGQKRAARVNYIFALLMARHPDAEKERVAFLEEVKSDSQGWIYRGMFEPFDRMRTLHQIFGQ